MINSTLINSTASDAWVHPPTQAFDGGQVLVLLRNLVSPPVGGIPAALLLVLVRTIGMFELTFLTSGPTSQTLVVAL